MRMGWLVVGSVLLGCLLAGCRVISAADSADDTKKWQGAWKLVACTYDGEPQMADMEWIVDGDRYTIRLNGHINEDPHMPNPYPRPTPPHPSPHWPPLRP